MAGQFGLRFRLPRKSQGSFTYRKSAKWDRRLYFSSEGRHAVDFSTEKSDGFGRVRTPDLGYQRLSKPLLQWILDIFIGDVGSDPDLEHPSPSSVEVKNEWSLNAISPPARMTFMTTHLPNDLRVIVIVMNMSCQGTFFSKPNYVMW
jgi:hypothetical protein